MTKHTKPPIETQAITTTKPAGPPAMPSFLGERLEADAGKGVSTDAADNQVPLITILDAKSPQVDKHDRNNYIDGAEPGDIWLRGAPEPIIKGDEGFMFQPCHFSHDWNEWAYPRQPGQPGFKGRHTYISGNPPLDAVERPHPEDPRKKIWVREQEGTQMVETRTHSGFAYQDGMPFPYSIPFASTGHTVSRQWMTMMNMKQSGDGQRIPAFATMYRLRTKQRKNAKGTWFIFVVEDAGWVQNEQDYERGKALYEAFASGEKQAAAPLVDQDGDVSGNDTDNSIGAVGEEVPF